MLSQFDKQASLEYITQLHNSSPRLPHLPIKPINMAALETHNGFYLWKYVPSIAAAGIFAALFIMATFAHFWRIHTTKSKFCMPFAIGCFCKSEFNTQSSLTNRATVEFVGYCARASAHSKTGKLMPYIIQNLLILVAPALFAASIYMTLGRIMRAVKGERLSLV